MVDSNGTLAEDKSNNQVPDKVTVDVPKTNGSIKNVVLVVKRPGGGEQPFKLTQMLADRREYGQDYLAELPSLNWEIYVHTLAVSLLEVLLSLGFDGYTVKTREFKLRLTAKSQTMIRTNHCLSQQFF